MSGALEDNGPRARILAKVRAALSAREREPHPGPLPALELDSDRKTDLAQVFAGALERAGGESVFLADLGEAVRWLDAFASEFDSVAVGAGVPAELRPALPVVDAAEAGLGVSRAEAAAASTGSLILSSREGRRHQLLPPAHLIWLDRDSIHVDLSAALAAVRAEGPLPPALALHSGPSKSADIGRMMVRGVHGPGRVIAAVLARPPAR